MKKIQAKLAIFIISLFDNEIQLKIHSQLNGWQLHWSLIIPFFNYYLVNRYYKMDLFLRLDEWMEAKFGRKEILRYHNVRSESKGDMTNEQFEDWWTFSRNNKIDEYYKKYLLSK